jgi:hypothetical protein
MLLRVKTSIAVTNACADGPDLNPGNAKAEETFKAVSAVNSRAESHR